MSLTVKLIIELPTDKYLSVKTNMINDFIYDAVKHGIPLDSKSDSADAKIKEARDTLLRLRHEVGYIRKKDIEDAFAGIVEGEK